MPDSPPPAEGSTRAGSTRASAHEEPAAARLPTQQNNLRTWCAFVGLACAVFAASLAASFQSDDYSVLAAVRRAGPFALWSGPGSTAPLFLRPVVSASLFLDHLVWG